MDLNLIHLLSLSDLCKAAKLSITTMHSKAFCDVILFTMIYFRLIVMLKYTTFPHLEYFRSNSFKPSGSLFMWEC